MGTLKEIARWLGGSILEGLGEAAAELLVIGVLCIIFFLGSLPIYFLLKKFGVRASHGRPTTFTEDLKEFVTARPAPAAETPALKQLREVREGLTTFYGYFLWLVLALATGFMFWFFAKLRNDPSRAFLQAYFGIGYLMLVGWVLATQWTIRRQRKSGPDLDMPSSLLHFNVRSKTSTFTLDQASLEAARVRLDGGASIESVCAAINSQYGAMGLFQRGLYEQCVKSAVELSRNQSVGAGQPVPVETEEVLSFKTSDPPSATPAPPNRPWMSSSQIVLLVAFFCGAFALFTTVFFYFMMGTK